jgi:hypothetical protein
MDTITGTIDELEERKGELADKALTSMTDKMHV